MKRPIRLIDLRPTDEQSKYDYARLRKMSSAIAPNTVSAKAEGSGAKPTEKDVKPVISKSVGFGEGFPGGVYWKTVDRPQRPDCCATEERGSGETFASHTSTTRL